MSQIILHHVSILLLRLCLFLSLSRTSKLMQTGKPTKQSFCDRFCVGNEAYLPMEHLGPSNDVTRCPCIPVTVLHRDHSIRIEGESRVHSQHNACTKKPL